MNIRPICVVCSTKFYVKGPEDKWRLIDVSSVKGTLVSTDYLYQKGIVCPECIPKVQKSSETST